MSHSTHVSLTLAGLSQKLIRAILFFLPFGIFSLNFGGGESRLGITEVLGFILVGVNLGPIIFHCIFARMDKSEKLVMLCLMVAILSLVVAQLLFGWPEQLQKGIKQILGISFIVLFFLNVRFYINTPETFASAVTWLWRGCLILALLGIWQSMAFNVLHTSFLADWSWVPALTHSPFHWQPGGNMGPIIRVNSLSWEPSHYCLTLLMVMGLVTMRLIPVPMLADKRMHQYLPSRRSAILLMIAYLVSFSLLGILGFIIVVVSHILLFAMASLRKTLMLLLIGIILIFGLNLVTQGKLFNKVATIILISPLQEKEFSTEAVSALVIATNMDVAWQGILHNPFLGWGVGGHPAAFERFIPEWIERSHSQLAQINIQDAASLALRLLSEMGILGLIAFLGTFGFILVRAWKAIAAAKKLPERSSEILSLCAGLLTGTIAAVGINIIRYPSYIFIPFWAILALTSVIPEVLGLQGIKKNS